MSRNKQRASPQRRPASVQQIVGGPGPTVDAVGKTWRLGFNDQNAKGALEELIRAHVIRRELPIKKALGPEEGQKYWENEIRPLFDAGYYDTFGMGWLATMKSPDGVILFLQSLLLRNHPEVTLDRAREIFAEEPDQVIAAVEVVAPDFFASAAVQMGHSTEDAKKAAPIIAESVREQLAKLREERETQREPATASTTGTI